MGDQVGLQEAPLSAILCTWDHPRTRSGLQRLRVDTQESSSLFEADRAEGSFVHAGCTNWGMTSRYVISNAASRSAGAALGFASMMPAKTSLSSRPNHTLI